MEMDVTESRGGQQGAGALPRPLDAHTAEGDLLPTDGTRDDAADVTNCETAAVGVFSVI
jgi:hypothetical protein